MKKQTQREFVENELLKEGRISRNYCLQLYDLKVRTNILRLGAIICDMIKDGWEIKGDDEMTPTGKDFVYTLVTSPKKKVTYFVPSLGKTIEVYK